MPATCTVCSSPMRELVDREHLAGSSYAAIAKLAGDLSAASIRRHCQEHLRRPSLFAGAIEPAAVPELGDVADRWAESIADAERVRDDARERGDARLMLQATQARADLLERFSQRFGGNLSVGETLREHSELVRIIGRTSAERPSIADELADRADTFGYLEMASTIRAIPSMHPKYNQENE